MKDRYREIPGRQEGQVELLVRQNVIERWGQPKVDFAGLTELVEEAGLSPEDTILKLYSGRWVGDEPTFRRFAMGGHVPFTHTIYSGVGVNNRPPGLPGPYNLAPDVSAKRVDHYTATMSKLVRNVLRAGGVRGWQDTELDTYQRHALDIQFTRR